MVPPLILASTSRYRAAELERLGVPFTCEKPAIDERALGNHLPPAALAEHLAIAKAKDVAQRFPDAVVIGGDQVCALGNEILHKPGTSERACAQLTRMAGKTHHLHTGVCIIAPGHGPWSFCESTALIMRPLDAESIRRYVARDEPFDCAGAYKLERGGIALMERIVGDDHTAIIGIPLMAVVNRLRVLGFAVP